MNQESPMLSTEQVSFLRWFSKYDLKEMEIAASIMLIEESAGTSLSDTDIYSVLTVSKPWISPGAFSGILEGIAREKTRQVRSKPPAAVLSS